MKIDETTLEKAYKKLKSSVYFDKTLVILRNHVVDFESKLGNVDDYLKGMFEKLSDDKKFSTFQKQLIESISVLAFPKKLEGDDSSIIMNSVSKKNKVNEVQYFIDLDVEGHILSVLWLMLLGYKIDKNVYEHSYGNRIRKNLINEFSDNPTYSPYLFQPYFEQYESWRDTALSEAKAHMELKQDVVIITMDFRRYYYSVDADKRVFDALYEEALNADVEENDYDEEDKEILQRLNGFIYAVVEKYSKLFEDEFGNKHILPIGFLPSNVIANWCLKNFDKAVVDGWNPVYYGRYVDDVLIVDKIENNSDIYNKAKKDELTRDDVIDFFLKKCSKWNGISKNSCDNLNKYALIQPHDDETNKARNEAKLRDPKSDIDNIFVYRVNPLYNVIDNNASDIIVHNDKVKIFYFKSNESDALLTCFRENISKNKSEFRFLPEDEAVFQKDDYSEIYSIESSDTINKFRGIDGISIDRFHLSKFLGKYLRIGSMINDKVESKFEKDILKIFNSHTIIENYFAWEKSIEILVLNERFDAVEKFVKQIIDAIDAVEFSSDESKTSADDIKKTLYSYLHSVLCRSFALIWKPERYKLQEKIYSIIKFIKRGLLGFELLSDDWFLDLPMAYCKTGMIDKSVMPINIFMLRQDEIFNPEAEINLSILNDVMPLVKTDVDYEYKYYPYLINMYDICMATFIKQLRKDIPYDDVDMINEKQKAFYVKSNYRTTSKLSDIERLVTVNRLNTDSFQVCVGDGKKSKLKIAIANVKLSHRNFKSLIIDKPNRSYRRYKDLSVLVNQAIEQRADMLIMPEAYVPYEWLSTLSRTCAKNSLAIVTGVEYIKFNDKIFNFTAVILPYKESTYRCAHISFHLKTHYAPNEKEEINGYRLKEVIGTHYELYKWNDCYFPVYCCYELASIHDRAMFQSYADMLVAVEWNRDINYYSNILESLSRDIHCYCIQVNTSNYGDSRITKPSKTEEKDVIRTKGGINNTILVDEIDINALREFQIKEFALQKSDKSFKITPPDFDKEIVMKKIKGEVLYKELGEKNNSGWKKID